MLYVKGVSMLKRIFAPKRVPSVSKSVRIPEPMLEALEKLAGEAGETLNFYIILVLEDYLQRKLKKGEIEAPDLDQRSS
jgi:hypothetical protein